jgi:hypothetical protein
MIFLARREIAETKLDDRTGDCLVVPTPLVQKPSTGGNRAHPFGTLEDKLLRSRDHKLNRTFLKNV